MREKASEIRKARPCKKNKYIMFGIFVMAGLLSGMIAKVFDETPVNRLPAFLEALDPANLFSRMGVWMFIGFLISIYSPAPSLAAGNVFSFFLGQITGYFAFSALLAGFFPLKYMLLWAFVCLISPLCGAVCWYAYSTHIISVFIGAVVYAFFLRQAFVFGFWYLDITYLPELAFAIAFTGALYKSPDQILRVTLLGAALFFIGARINLFGGML